MENAASAYEGFVHFEKRIFGCGADQDNRAVFDPGQQSVLLTFIPAMNFIVHAGRRGMLDGVVTAAVAALVAAGADPSDLWAATGPSICGNCYEVSEDMAQQAAAVEPACRATSRWGTPAIDVAAGVHAQLERAGVGHMHPGHWCTAEDERFFSYRRQGATGRIAGVAIAGRTAGGQAGASSVTRRGQ